MTYPRNAASPPRIAIGPVVAIADGAVQTSGVSVKVMPEGGAAGASGGTVAYEEGIVHYVPTQAETNYTAFMLIAYKASCLPAAVTVVTTASATAGKVVLSGETHTDAVIPTVTTLTNLPAITAGWLTATGIAADAITEAKIADNAIAAEHLAANAIDLATFAADCKTGSALKANVETITNGAITAAAIATNAIDDDAIAADVTAVIAAAVWNAAIASYGTSGTYGEALEAVGAAADPWLTPLPGSYGAGTAGYIIGTGSTLTASDIADAVWDEAATDHTDAGKAGAQLWTDIDAILDDTGSAGVVVAAASKTGYTLTATTGLGNQTANITGTVSGNSTHTAANVVTAMGTGTFLTAVPWNAAWDAEVQSECDDAITASTLMKRIAVGSIGDVTDAGTGTEVFVYGGVTATVTVDSSGNRSIAWS